MNRRVTAIAPARASVTATVKRDRITWYCILCGKPIDAHTGYLDVDDMAALRRHDRDSWCPVIHWTAYHDTCGPDPEEARYPIHVERIGTLRRALWWAGHLSTKLWIDDTDWSDLMKMIGDSSEPS